ncbi:DEAD/DEAH box helicase [Pseudoxanthomonas sp. NC8]|nr:DEAD/DEAH box helicase [Pseudoxanthomonas sp. NC8]
MKDPIGAFERIQDSVKRYVTSAFATNSPSFERDRKTLLDTPGVFFQHPYVEPLPSYESGQTLDELVDGGLPGMTPAAGAAFGVVASAGLFKERFPLYVHQQRMLEKALEGKHCVVVTGTGSGKTESFLLPVIASVVREAKREATARSAATRRPAPWTRSNLPSWDEVRPDMRQGGPSSSSPCPALVPDERAGRGPGLSPKGALDSDEAHAAMDEYLGGNRIRFGRYNGSTPVSGHPFKAADGSANTSARSKLKTAMREAVDDHLAIRRKIDAARATLESCMGSPNEDAARNDLNKLLEQSTFMPRMDPNAAECFHRWEMQASPPDLLITNVSMLSIMLMRHRDPEMPSDRADSQVFDATREWLASDRDNNVFQLVIDELHLYRGTAGTEVAYLIRLLLDRLGLSPDSPQLQILASSASRMPRMPARSIFLAAFSGLAKTPPASASISSQGF